MKKTISHSANAPKPSGTYSSAIQVGQTVYLAGQIPLDPHTGELVGPDIDAQVRQVFSNLQAVAEAAGGSLNDLVKLNVYLKEFSHFPYLNQIMPEFFVEPYPARTTIGVAALPKNALIEIDGVMMF
jgi:reactive intermediate/imine deaminase